MPETDSIPPNYIDRFSDDSKIQWLPASSRKATGHAVCSDPEHAPGPGNQRAFFTYGLLWGMNNGLLDKAAYQPVVMKAWNYLTTVVRSLIV